MIVIAVEFAKQTIAVIGNHQLIGDLRIIVYEYVKLFPVNVDDKKFLIHLQRALCEYRRIGVLHTDFGLVNIGRNDEKNYFFDYGTALCDFSNQIRIRKNSFYNHFDKITTEALDLLPDADFYYNDIAHLNMDCIDVDNNNFLVANDNTVFAKLGNKIIKYFINNDKLVK